MADWNPTLYSRFEDERTRPARDLLARCALEKDGAMLRIADLGCGPGNSTALLAERFPAALITGYDSSDAMLDAARRRLPGLVFEKANIATLGPVEKFDLVFSNAALQWVRGHRSLLPRLFSLVAPGGLLAFQVPDNLADPSQTAMRALASQPEFASFFEGHDEGREPIASTGEYYDWLARDAADVDVWLTVYHHPMESARAITEWFSSTGLKPFTDSLPEPLKELFRERYTAMMETAYARHADGRRLLTFPRLFVVARKA